MIQNERQYRITKSAADKFEAALAAIAHKKSDLHPLLAKAEADALRSQLVTLTQELTEYESLRSGQVRVLHLESLEAIPEGLIKARIASGLTQKQLAERLGLKEQQIQKYESEFYKSASLQRLADIANALGVTIREELFVGETKISMKALLKRLSDCGFSDDFMEDKLFDPKWEDLLSGAEGGEAKIVSHFIELLRRIFGWSFDELLSTDALNAPRLSTAVARYKLPLNRDNGEVAIYSSYAHYLARLTAQCVSSKSRPSEIRQLIKDKLKGTFSLKLCLETLWNSGIAVLPLNDKGTFHGACWRFEGTNVIVLKQVTSSHSRWLFDLLHETYHATQLDEATELEILELAPEDRRTSPEESAANEFAASIMLGKNADQLIEECLLIAGGNIAALKSVVLKIATARGVEPAHLANCVAFTLASKEINWWGAASNLEMETMLSDSDPWLVAREVFINRMNFLSLDDFDCRLFQQAMQ